ncbi:hypothetical protein [Wolbachia endosymbiont of Tetranychus urticae]
MLGGSKTYHDTIASITAIKALLHDFRLNLKIFKLYNKKAKQGNLA